MQQKMKPSISQPLHFQEVFRKCFHNVKENKGNLVKQCGTDVENFQFFDQFSYPCVRLFTKINVTLFHSNSCGLLKEVHVSHMISVRRMSKRLSNQPTARLLGLHVSCLSWTKSTKNRGHVHIGHFIITVFY